MNRLPEARRATKWASNVRWSTRKALKILARAYGPSVKFASVKINLSEDWLEVALFSGLLTQEEAEQAADLAKRGRIYFFIPDARAGTEPKVMES